MDVLRIAIVEDDDQFAQELENYLKRYAGESTQSLETVRFTDGEDIAIGYKADFDIILLDVQMRFMDGMTAAQYIRERDDQVIIIFITNMAQYAIRGYEVDALDYVVKPVNYFAFSQRLDRAVARMRRRQTSYITAPVSGGVQKLATASIYYIESQGHTLLYHTDAGVVESSGVLKDVAEKLAPYSFFRCNKGYLLNLQHVDGIRDSFALVQGEKVPISRPRRAALLEALTNYVGETVK